MSLNHKECKGCEGYINEDVVCTMEPFYIIEGRGKIYCPCLTCIVKGMCKEGCDLSINYAKFSSHLDIVLVLKGE